jgi:hypothetical protein
VQRWQCSERGLVEDGWLTRLTPPLARPRPQVLGKVEQMLEVVNKVNDQFKDPELTTFV